MLYQSITEKMKEAMKAGDEFSLSVFRMLVAAIKNKEIEKRGKGLEPELTEEEVAGVLSKEAKKRKEAADIFASGGRPELADKEVRELAIIKKFLPEDITTEDLRKIIDEVLSGFGKVEMKDFGKVMGEIMKRANGRADASALSAALKERIVGNG